MENVSVTRKLFFFFLLALLCLTILPCGYWLLLDKKDVLFYWEAQSFIHYALTHRIPEFIK